MWWWYVVPVVLIVAVALFMRKTPCQVSKWDTGTCSASCGGGTRQDTRTVVVPGDACPPLERTVSCNADACPVNCAVSDFGPWSACSKTCGGGEQTRTKTVLTPPQGTGQACPNLTDTRPCNTQPCPVDCAVTDWANGTCSKPCAGGTQTQTRTVKVPPVGTGAACPALTQQAACNTHACPVDCQVSDWSVGACDKPCGTGAQTRTRTVTTAPVGTGKACPPLQDSQPCNTQACPVDCQVSGWGAWSTCSKQCETGERTRTRTVTVPPVGTGAACPALTESGTCNPHPCTPDMNCYMKRYPDLLKAFGGDTDQALNHYNTSGRVGFNKEGRNPYKGEDVVDANGNCPAPDWFCYMKRYPDLLKAFGGDSQRARQHYMQSGADEGRIPYPGPDVTDASGKCPIPDFGCYIKRYPDLLYKWGDNVAEGRKHFMESGANEGRNPYPGTDTGDTCVIDWNCYMYRYKDLQAAFAGDVNRARTHFLQSGGKEDRNPYWGTDLGLKKGESCPAPNWQCYMDRYNDVKNAKANDPNRARQHFMESGAREGRNPYC